MQELFYVLKLTKLTTGTKDFFFPYHKRILYNLIITNETKNKRPWEFLKLL